jgi:type II secretion system protein J
MISQKPRTGFTLIELLVGITMIITIIGAIYSSYVAVAQSDHRYRRRLSLAREAGRTLQQMTVLLQGSYTPKQRVVDPNHAQPKGPLKITTVPRFESQYTDTGGTLLRWITTHAWDDEMDSRGLWYTTLRWDRNQHQLLINQIPFIWGEPAESSDVWGIVGEQIHRIELTFYDQGKWYKTWPQDQTRRLPELVKIELTLHGDNQQDLLFSTTAGPLALTAEERVL